MSMPMSSECNNKPQQLSVMNIEMHNSVISVWRKKLKTRISDACSPHLTQSSHSPSLQIRIFTCIFISNVADIVNPKFILQSLCEISYESAGWLLQRSQELHELISCRVFPDQTNMLIVLIRQSGGANLSNIIYHSHSLSQAYSHRWCR